MRYLFWLQVLIVVHVWVGYIILLKILSIFLKREVNLEGPLPGVTVLLTVHNEEKLVESRIKNLLDSQYPRELLEILVASDGSTDATDHLVSSLSLTDHRIKLFATQGGGKSFTQNQAIPRAHNEIVLLTDGSTTFEPHAIKGLVRHFNDESVGCVTGRCLLREKDNSISASHSIYWKAEMLIRRLESSIGTLHTASGQFMAFRKSLFRPFSCKYGDDCIIPLDILLQYFRVVHEDKLLAYEEFPSTIKGELKARTRMTLRNLTCTLSKYPLLNPIKYPLISLSIFSHKLLRWLTPFFLLAIFISNLLLVGESSIYPLTLWAQLIFYALGLIGLIGEQRGHRLPLASLVFSFLLANLGFFLGVINAIIGKEITSYET
ncbi:MAG: glycosyltransferase [Deltaproteobacteria bacterium]|nr:glycosyltransferase [Deltaproteobacteria bacterium]